MQRLCRSMLKLAVLCLALAGLGACSGGGLATLPSPTTRPTLSSTGSTPILSPSAGTTGWIYQDPKLGFRLTVPSGWLAQSQPGTQPSPNQEAVTFQGPQQQESRAVIVLAVFQSPDMPAAFAARGTPGLRIGPYPAFTADRLPDEGRAPCLIRILLAGDDYVLADWCAPDALHQSATFTGLLASFQPAPATFYPQPVAAPAAHTCQTMRQQLGYTGVSWGQQLATPQASGWRQLNTGIFVCSNDASPDWYLFQCTELVNRFLLERWGLPHLPGNAARYLDYYQNGVLHQGTIHEFPAGSYQISDDASQGQSAFRPRAGDILVFQDVVDPRAGWRSGLVNSPGHVALIVGVDSSFVYLAQENYNDSQYFLALPLHQVANGYRITDRSGWNQRIVRGWIHFTNNGGSAL